MSPPAARDINCEHHLAETARIHERLGTVAETIASGFAKLETAIGSHGKRLECLEDTTFGNGSPGIKIRVDRIEQSAVAAKERRAVWLTVAGLAGGVVAAAVQVVAKMLMGG